MLGFGKRKSRSAQGKTAKAANPASEQTVLFDDEENVVYLDDDGVYRDAHGNPVDMDGADVEIVYVDEDGNEIAPDDDVEIVYVDEEGNEIVPGIDGDVVFVDEDGNVVLGDLDDDTVYVDEDGIYYDARGNVLDPSQIEFEDSEIVYVNEDGDEVEHDGDGRVIALDEDDDVIMITFDEDSVAAASAAGSADEEEILVAEYEEPTPADADIVTAYEEPSAGEVVAEAEEADDDSAEYEAARAAIQASFQKHAAALERAHAAGAITAAVYAEQLKAQGEECRRQLDALDEQYEFIEEDVEEPAQESAAQKPAKKKLTNPDAMNLRETAEDLKVVVRTGAETLRDVRDTVKEFKELTDFKSWLK